MNKNHINTILGGNAVPAWVVSVIVGVGMLIIGGVVYGIMRKIVLSASDSESSRIAYQPTIQNEV